MNAPGNISVVDFPEEGLSAIVKWRNDGEVNKYLRPGYGTLEEVRDWYHGYFSSCGNQLLAIKADDNLIGYCTIEGVDRANNKCEVGIVLGERAYWGKGIGSSVIRELLQRAFTDLRMHRVEAVMHEDNIASVRCFTRVGFLLDGRLRDAKFRDGRYVDLLVYSILHEEWEGAHR